MTPADFADLAELYLQRQANLTRRRMQLYARLERINRALAEAEEYELNEAMPADLRRALSPPLLTYAQVKAWRATILELIGEVEALLNGNAARAQYSTDA